MPMDADRQDKYDAMCRHETALSNGKANDDGYKTSVLIDLCRALKTMLGTDFVKPDDMEHFCAQQHAKRLSDAQHEAVPAADKKYAGVFNMSIGSALVVLGGIFGVVKSIIYIVEKTNGG